MKLGGVVYILSIEWLIQGWHGLCKSNLSIYLLFEINFRINRIVWSDEPTILWQTTTYYQYLHYWIFVSSWLLSYHIGSDRVGRRKLIFVLKNCFVSFRFVSICLLFVLSLSISKIVILREKNNKIVSVVVVVVVVVKCLPGKNNFSSIYWIGLDGFPPRLSASYGLNIYIYICPWNLFLCVLKSPRRWEN